MARVPIGERDKGPNEFYRITANYLLRWFHMGFQDYGLPQGPQGIIDPRYDTSKGYNCRISAPPPQFDHFILEMIDIFFKLFLFWTYVQSTFAQCLTFYRINVTRIVKCFGDVDDYNL